VRVFGNVPVRGFRRPLSRVGGLCLGGLHVLIGDFRVLSGSVVDNRGVVEPFYEAYGVWAAHRDPLAGCGVELFLQMRSVAVLVV